jgi:hypothetical protein
MMTEAERANERAQEAFHAALAAYTELETWDNPATDAYLNAERDVEWEEAKAALDAKITADHDMHRTFNVYVTECEDCCCDPESRGISAADFLTELQSWSPGELQEAWGR